MNQLNEGLVKGYNIEADIEYYINYTKKDVLNFGAALHFNYMHHQTAGSDLNIPNYGHVNRYKESQIACYIAPAFVMRYDLTKWLFTSSIGLGPLFFTNPATADITTITGKDVTLGSHFGIEADYKISPNWGIGVRLATAGGSIRSINFNGITTKLDKPMSASSWTISGILSFRTK